MASKKPKRKSVRKKPLKHYNGLTPGEAERLALLAEECAETIQVIGKILRHGYESCHPDDPNRTTNRGLLEKELGDVVFAKDLLVSKGDVKDSIIHEAYTEKAQRVVQYLHHQKRNDE